MEGDATHLKETEVKGTKMNKELTAFRLKTSNMMPPGVVGSATQYIYEQPASPLCTYLLTKYFIMTNNPDYDKIQKLGDMIMKAQPGNTELAAILKKLDALKAVKVGSSLPAFSAKGLKGESVSAADLNAKVNVVSLWASWNYESLSIQALLARFYREHPGQLKVLGVSVDGSVKDCQHLVDRDSIKWSTVCDGKMWDMPILHQLGMTYLPDNIIVDKQGKIIARTLNYQDLNNKIQELIGN
jgi:peroxiredoxin